MELPFQPDPRFGAPGIRDPYAPCDLFDPVDRVRVLGVVQPPWEDCGTDGHYLCRECRHRTTPERMARYFDYDPSEYDIP